MNSDKSRESREAILREVFRLNDAGREQADAGDWDAALAFYQQAIDLFPVYSPVLYNMGLIYKWRRQWADCLDANERAARRLPEDHGDPALWNLGIAATALHRWDVAREAWRRYGVSIPDGEGELELDFGPTPIRLNPDGNAEVVWGTRIDPARVVIRNVPTPESGHHWGDIVLHDGEPKGERTIAGRVCSVFDEIELWKPSGIPTLSVEVTAADAEDSRALEDAFAEAGLAAEDWTKELRFLCKACSEGTAPEGHEHPPAPHTAERHFGLAAPLDVATRLLTAWAAERPGTRAHSEPVIAEALSPRAAISPRAGTLVRASGRPVDGAGATGRHRPVPVAVRPVPPLSRVVDEPGRAECLRQDGAVAPGFSDNRRVIGVARSSRLLRRRVDDGAEVELFPVVAT